MLKECLNYSGTARPLAQLVGGPPFRISVGDREKPWTATKPQAFWRSLGDLALRADVDPRELANGFLEFVRRFGPLAEPTAEDLATGSDTSTWLTTSRHFAEVAKAWEPEDAAGISRLSPSRTRRDAARRWLGRFLLPAAMDDARYAFDAELRIVLETYSLVSFMAHSAALALQRRAPMRRCQHCQFWFEPERSDTRYCSNSCRHAHYVASAHLDHAVPPPRSSHKRVRSHGQRA